MVVAGLGLMGCIPSILAQSPSGRCSDEVNQLVQPFNANVKTMINNLNTNLPGARFTYIDVARMFQDILINYRAYGKNFYFIFLFVMLVKIYKSNFSSFFININS